MPFKALRAPCRGKDTARVKFAACRGIYGVLRGIFVGEGGANAVQKFSTPDGSLTDTMTGAGDSFSATVPFKDPSGGRQGFVKNL